jgi:hypothetical protein
VTLLILASLVVLVLASISLLPHDVTEATHGPHPLSETPGSDKVVIFSPLLNEGIRQSEATHVATRLQQQNYTSQLLVDRTGPDDKPETATAETFKRALMNPRGVLFVTSHGDTDKLLVEARADETDCYVKLLLYVAAKKFDSGELECGEFPLPGGGHAWGIAMTSAAITHYFRDSETIVYIDACQSWSLRVAFSAAREFLGHDACPLAPKAAQATFLFWSRMHGEEGNGEQRWVSVAAAGLPAKMRWQHRPNTLDTELSPSVKEVMPPKESSFAAPTTMKGSVIFDTLMDTTVPAVSLINVEGCDARIRNQKWDPPRTVTFDLDLNTTGTATLTVPWGNAKAQRDFKNFLDGNQNPQNTDHVGPNRDDFKWRVFCTSGTQTPSPAPTVTPPPGSTNTPAPGPTNTPQPTPTNTPTPAPKPSPTVTPTATMPSSLPSSSLPSGTS